MTRLSKLDVSPCHHLRGSIFATHLVTDDNMPAPRGRRARCCPGMESRCGRLVWKDLAPGDATSSCPSRRCEGTSHLFTIWVSCRLHMKRTLRGQNPGEGRRQNTPEMVLSRGLLAIKITDFPSCASYANVTGAQASRPYLKREELMLIIDRRALAQVGAQGWGEK